MIRSLGRNGIVERCVHPPPPIFFTLTRSKICPNHRTLASGRQPTSLVSRRLRRDVHAFSLASSSGVRCSQLHPHYARLLSTAPSPPPPTPGKTAASEPPTPLAARKPKVELRPAPPSPPASASAAAEKSTASSPLSSASDISSDAPPPMTLIEITRRDLRDAQLRGILAAPPASAGRVGKLYHQAKEMFKFYWRGLKLFNTHRLQVREIKDRVKNGGPPMDRWETRFVRTFNQDAMKMIPFVLIVLVVEEIIPLIAIYAPFMLPSTCIMPSQWERIDGKRREKQLAFAESLRDEFATLRKAGSKDIPLHAVPNGYALIALAGSLTLSTVGPAGLHRRRIQRHLTSIAADDVLLRQENMGNRLTHPELLEALEERGIPGATLDSEKLKARLRWWLTNADKADAGDAVGRRIALVARNALGQL
ncbi:hypothetical protein EVG20_g7874 [Dentipellis fragilis]|uniref:Letm1 RBD domain-containing protein n=1 Tax=Dentipellis fragilis TaxID=205917 RepID=A0A4Y9YAG0_9AGAM|nr:hypothetical protein EVG20_g7874 [Dentipellis fragilis]